MVEDTVVRRCDVDQVVLALADLAEDGGRAVFTRSRQVLLAKDLLHECLLVVGVIDHEAPVEAEEQVDFWDWVATTGEFFERRDAAKQDERRKEPRIDVHVPLCIAAADGEEEMVASQNISKTGLCFLSLKTYQSGEALEVTLQPPGALAPQTKTATIVRSTPAGSGMTLYGARIEP